MMSLLYKLKNHSFKEIWNYIVSQVLKTEVKKYHYMRLNTDIDIVRAKLQRLDLKIENLTYKMVLTGDSNVFIGSKLELYKERFRDSSYKGFGICENGQLIYSTWISLSKISLPWVSKTFELAENEGLLEDSYCAPVARGRGLHGEMNWYRLAKLYEMGKTRVIAIVQDGNVPAMKVQLKCGFEELGTFICGRFLGVPFVTLKKRKYDYR